jgi:hypothetical protein
MTIDTQQGTIDGKAPGQIPHGELAKLKEGIDSLFHRHTAAVAPATTAPPAKTTT